MKVEFNILRCPFCDGDAELNEEHDIFFRAFVVGCKRCGVRQPYPKYETPEKAIGAWNTRGAQ